MGRKITETAKKTMEKILKRQAVFYLFALLLLAISLFLHFRQLGQIPAGIHIDESSTAYNALCIAETGMDEHGNKYPVFFKAFGDYKNPVMIYTLVPFIKIFGFTTTIIRSPSALFHILASIAFFFLAYKFSHNKWISLVGAFVFSMLPWIFPVSRIILCGFTAMLLFIILGWILIMKSFSSHSFLAAMLSGLFFALSMYSTHSGRPITAVILICFVPAYNTLILKRWKFFGVFLCSFVIFLIPMILFVLNTPEALTSRFNAISVWRDNPGLFECVHRIFLRYLEYFGPSFLFIVGDPNITHCTGASGELYLFLLPFIVAGICVILMGFNRNPHYRFIFLCLLLYPAAAVFTIGHGHSTACINGTIFWLVTSVIGTGYMVTRKKKFRIVIATALLLMLYEMSAYMINYFCKYKTLCRQMFNAGIVEVIEYALANLDKAQTLYISKFVFFPEILQNDFKPEFYANMLFLTKLAPETYQKYGIPPEKAAVYDGKDRRAGLLIRLDSIPILNRQGNLELLKDYEKVPEDAKLVKTFPTPSGINFQVYKLKNCNVTW